MSDAAKDSLWQMLSDLALENADQPAGAVAALMRAATVILQRDFGDEAAALMLVEIIADATSKMTGSSGIVATRH